MAELYNIFINKSRENPLEFPQNERHGKRQGITGKENTKKLKKKGIKARKSYPFCGRIKV